MSKSGVPEVTEPKTKNSRRKIAITSSILEILKSYREEQVREQNIIPFQGGKYLFIFCHPNGEAFHKRDLIYGSEHF